ncbi:MAG: hypothetical protein HOW73_28190 [Polyangiaceae bacterium]|nr:hypothetical protein [Polyangiaceae bacterium]
MFINEIEQPSARRMFARLSRFEPGVRTKRGVRRQWFNDLEALVLAVPLLVACSSEDNAQQGTANPDAPASTSALIVTPPSPSASGAAETKAAPIPFAGSWKGTFDAKKAPVSLDPGVVERSWKADDGKAASGPGTIQLVVAPDGIVTGDLSGSLGEAKLTGFVEERRLTATFTPSSQDADPAMHGTINLEAGADDWSGELRASSGDATLVRSSTLTLKRAP